MSRLKNVEVVLSRSRKKIVYFVSDDYDIIRQAVNGKAVVFEQYFAPCGDSALLKCFQTKEKEDVDVYEKLSGLYIQDCRALVVKDFFHGRGSGERSIKIKDTARIFVYPGFHLLQESTRGDFLSEFLGYAEDRLCLLILSGAVSALPRGYENMVEVIDIPGPDEDDIKDLLFALAKRQPLDEGARARIAAAAYDFKGLELSEVRAVADELTGRYGSFYGRTASLKGPFAGADDDFEKIAQERQSVVRRVKKENAMKDPTMAFLEPQKSVAGFHRYKSWLEARSESFQDPAKARSMGRERIRGVLMTGIPGTGKSQGAKYTASVLGLPLVQLRIDNLLGGLVGDSERNFKRYRKRIEMIAPCVVLIDEIEKLFAEQDGKGGGSNDVKQHLLSALLHWMQENQSGIFFYATCNSVKNLPPELQRNGRFSMRFSVFMPGYLELVEIICYHMKRIHILSGGNVFRGTEGIVRTQYIDGKKEESIIPTVAKDFLNEIAAYGLQEGRNMFFTGADIQALIDDVQYKIPDGCVRNMAPEANGKNPYLCALLSCAKSEFCQPYGETNLQHAVEFWVDALENSFTDVSYYGSGGAAPLSFRNFNREKGCFKSTSFDNDYDAYLFQVFQREICRAYKKRGQDDEHAAAEMMRQMQKEKEEIQEEQRRQMQELPKRLWRR